MENKGLLSIEKNIMKYEKRKKLLLFDIFYFG